MTVAAESKPFSGYTVSEESYVTRNSFGVISLYLSIQAAVATGELFTIAYVPDGYRPSRGYVGITAILFNPTTALYVPIAGYVYNNGDIKISTSLPTGTYSIAVTASYT